MTDSKTPTPKLDTGGPALQRLGRVVMTLIGWQVVGQELLTGPQYVLVVAPHTSNWDLPIGLICAHAFGFFSGWQCGFMIKESATQWPVVGRLLRFFGGIPIRRQAAQDIVDQMVDIFHQTERLVVAITPEGTRARRDYWKSGFYRIAFKANVPIALAFLDYKRRVAGVGKVIVPSGDPFADMQLFRDFYQTIIAKYPEKFGEVQLKPE
jgi:1-acyl-sn-glycerol-3-phosphate acyltransferase